MAARPNYRQTTIVPVAPEHNVPEAMNIEANPPPPEGFWQNHFVRTFILMLVVAAGYLVVRLGFLIKEKTQHHQHQLCTRTVVVSFDGTGDYTTVSGALEKAPDMSNTKFCLLIKRGRYTENVIVGGRKTNIAFIGEGADITILTATNKTTLEVFGEGFTAVNLSIENSGQALNCTSAHAAFYNCNITGSHSTLYTGKGMQLYRNCWIQGTSPLIIGDSLAYFQNCTIFVGQSSEKNPQVITSQGQERHWEDFGFVFDLCRIEPSDGSMLPSSPSSVYLGCPGGKYSRVVFMRSFISGVIDQKGWTTCNGYRPENVFFAEFNNTGPGSNTEGRIHWKGVKVLTNFEASQFRLRPFFKNKIDWLPYTGVPYLPD